MSTSFFIEQAGNILIDTCEITKNFSAYDKLLMQIIYSIIVVVSHYSVEIAISYQVMFFKGSVMFNLRTFASVTYFLFC